jgi:hypothetical protein
MCGCALGGLPRDQDKSSFGAGSAFSGRRGYEPVPALRNPRSGETAGGLRLSPFFNGSRNRIRTGAGEGAGSGEGRPEVRGQRTEVREDGAEGELGRSQNIGNTFGSEHR